MGSTTVTGTPASVGVKRYLVGDKGIGSKEEADRKDQAPSFSSSLAISLWVPSADLSKEPAGKGQMGFA